MGRYKVLLLSLITISLLAVIGFWSDIPYTLAISDGNQLLPSIVGNGSDKNSNVDEIDENANSPGISEKIPAIQENPETPTKSDNESESTSSIEDDSAITVDNLDDILILVNKTYKLPSDYKPTDLTVPNIRFSFEGPHEKQNMREEAARALEDLFAAAEEEEIFLYAVSGFRSYNLQESVYKNHVKQKGQARADKISARPGHSEHQTGLAMDISSKSANLTLSNSFAETQEGKWVAENAHLYGFIIRYQKGSEDITGYSYEPWHLRYVGKEAAMEIFEKNITLEEYLAISQPN
jgi:D-alanyl-D-alanine carboxypeptidase